MISIKVKVILLVLFLFMAACQNESITPSVSSPVPETNTPVSPATQEDRSTEITQNPLSGAVWRVIQLDTVKGGAIKPISETEINLILREDGKFYGNSGCNSYSGEYKLNGNAISFEESILTTEMYCETPEGVMEQEQRYMGLLIRAVSFRLIGFEMMLYDEDGLEMINYIVEVGER